MNKIKKKKLPKVGNVITIEAKTKLGNNAAKVKNSKLTFVFNKGVSESISVNDLFKTLAGTLKNNDIPKCSNKFLISE